MTTLPRCPSARVPGMAMTRVAQGAMGTSLGVASHLPGRMAANSALTSLAGSAMMAIDAERRVAPTGWPEVWVLSPTRNVDAESPSVRSGTDSRRSPSMSGTNVRSGPASRLSPAGAEGHVEVHEHLGRALLLARSPSSIRAIQRPEGHLERAVPPRSSGRRGDPRESDTMEVGGAAGEHRGQVLVGGPGRGALGVLQGQVSGELLDDQLGERARTPGLHQLAQAGPWGHRRWPCTGAVHR